MKRAVTSRGGFGFERLLASRRRPVEVRSVSNPFADYVLADLERHIRTIRRWVNGDMDTAAMSDAMRFFNAVFPGQYNVKAGVVLYRGQEKPVTDGTPRSYTYDASIAHGFGCEPGGGLFAKWFASHPHAYLIRRKVCHSCADKAAFRNSLDLSKLVSEYGTGKHKFSVEKEAVIFNTPVKPPARIEQFACERGAA